MNASSIKINFRTIKENRIMRNVRIPKTICSVVSDVLTGSHATLEALFESAGVPGPPPNLPHTSKWKEWLFRAGLDSETDSLLILGNLLEEFMDLPPNDKREYAEWVKNRDHVVNVLEESGFRYYRGGRVLPIGENFQDFSSYDNEIIENTKPTSIDELLGIIIRGVPRAMYPLSHRRKGVNSLSFETEWDIQDLLHALLRPWVSDIRPEEFTPSYAGTSTRMDFLLPKYSIVLELKYIRDKAHGRKIGDELIIDIEHYRCHPKCRILWCIIYDPNNNISNPDGLKSDIEGNRVVNGGEVSVQVHIISPR